MIPPFLLLQLNIFGLDLSELGGQVLKLGIEPVKMILVGPLEYLDLGLLCLELTLQVLLLPLEPVDVDVESVPLLGDDLLLRHQVLHPRLQLRILLYEVHLIVLFRFNLRQLLL